MALYVNLEDWKLLSLDYSLAQVW